MLIEFELNYVHIGTLLIIHTEKIAAAWHKPNSEVMGYVRARLMLAILRATNLCIRGSRVKWRRRMEIEDGAGLPYMQE